MSPQNNNELPPVYHGGPETQVPTEQYLPAHEQVAERVQAQAVEQAIAQPSPVMPPAAAPTTPVDPLALGAVATHPMPQIADDVELIEKEWVDKAKAIVNQTKHDPRAQTIEVGRVRADYLKRRFNKDLRVDEG